MRIHFGGKNDNGWIWIILLIVLFGTGIGRFFLGAAAVLAIAFAFFLFSKVFKKESGGKEKAAADRQASRQDAQLQRGAPVKEAKPAEEELPGMSKEDVKIFREARNQQRSILLKARGIRRQDIKTAAENFCLVADRILKALKSQPEEVRTAQLYLQYYLPAAGDMLSKYAQMEESAAATPEVCLKVQTYFQEAAKEGEKQLQAIFADDVAGIDAELEVLRQSRGESL